MENDGGPAFPSYANELVFNGDSDRTGHDELRPHGGMSIRDYFAAKVISQCQINVVREEPAPDAEVIKIYAERYARTAYAIADAMLLTRQRPVGTGTR